METYSMQALGAFKCATDVKKVVKVKTSYKNVSYEFEIILQFTGRTGLDLLEDATRMNRTDFLNGHRPLVNDSDEVVAAKVKYLEECVQKKQVAVVVGAKATTTIVTANPADLIAEAQKSGDWSKVQAMMDALKNFQIPTTETMPIDS